MEVAIARHNFCPRKLAMKFMLMCCFNEQQLANMPEEQLNQLVDDYGRLLDSLGKSGQRIGGGRLRPASTAVTIRAKNGRPVAMDGPFAETKEQLGGFHILECEDLDEAISIAMRVPTIPAGGVVEVRALEPMPENEATHRDQMLAVSGSVK